MRRWWHRILGGRRRAQRPHAIDIREEMLAHIALCTDDNVAAGMDPVAARAEAERRFGDLDRLVAEGREARRDPREPLGRFPNRSDQSPATTLMNDLVSDLRFGVRMLLKSPMFSLVAILSLGVGIGFNTTMFTVIDAVLFRPLPVDDPESVVRIRRTGDGFGDMLMSYPDYRDLRDSTESYDGLAASRMEMATYNDDGEVSFVFGETVSANYFGVLGIPPLLGRTFAPEEEIDGNHGVVMVSESFWRDRLGGSEGALGRELVIGGNPYTLIGVVPERYDGILPPIEMGFWLPTPATLHLIRDGASTPILERRQSHSYHVVGRLRDGVPLEEANAEAEGVAAQLAVEFADTNADTGFAAIPLGDVRIDPSMDSAMLPAAGVLMGLVGLVLLLACANVANMMLARGSVRRQEVGVRMALGAGRGRLIRQMLTESLILSVVGGVVAVLLARLAVRLLLTVQPPVMVPLDFAVDVSPRVLLFTGGLAILTGLAFGLVPALRSTTADLSQSLRGDEAGDGGATRGSRLRNGLVVAQVTVSLVLLVSAALMARSLQNAQSIDPGIVTDAVVTISPGLLFQGYDPDEAHQFHLEALERIGALPGVQQTAFAERLPLESSVQVTRGVRVEGQTYEDEDPLGVMTTPVDPSFFEVLGIDIVQGRAFAATDTRDAPRVVIVNEVLAEQLWPGESPLGKRVSIMGADGPYADVVGVHAPHKVRTLGEEPTPNLYVPVAQDRGAGFGTLIARVQGDPGEVLAGMRRVIREMDANVAVMEVETIGQHLALSLFPVRLSAAALGLLGIIGALLASVGVYGVVAFAVARRTREIGIRMAIGADRNRVLRMVLSQGMRLIALGAVLGLAISLAFTRVLTTMLYGVSATDAVAFIGAALMLALIGVVANIVPALRAAHVSPAHALRSE